MSFEKSQQYLRQNNFDQVLNEIEGINEGDEINKLLIKSRTYTERKQVIRGLEYANKAYDLSSRMGSEKYIIGSLVLKAWALWWSDRFKDTLQTLDQVEKRVNNFENYEDPSIKRFTAMAKYTRGCTLVNLNQAHKAFQFSKESLVLTKSIGDKKEIALSYWAIGLALYYNKDLKKGYMLFERAKELFDEINNTWGLAITNYWIGVFYRIVGEFKQAIYYHKLALKQYSEIDIKWGIAYSLNSLGIIHQELKNYQKSLIYLKKCLLTRLEVDIEKRIAETSHRIGQIYYQLNKYQQANRYLLFALSNYQKISFLEGIFITLSSLLKNKLSKHGLKF